MLDHNVLVGRFESGLPMSQFSQPLSRSAAEISVESCRESYSALAKEYEDEDHATIAEFHRLTSGAISEESIRLREVFKRVATGRWLVAGVGPGSNVSSVLESTASNPTKIDALDLSAEMITLAQTSGIRFSEYHVDDVRSFADKTRGAWDCVIALLADPYLDSSGIDSLPLLLANGGILLVSTPTAEWARQIRPVQSLNSSTFHLRDGTRRVAPSYCWDQANLAHEMAERGLEQLWSKQIFLDRDGCQSKVNLDAIRKSDLPELPILLLSAFSAHRG